MALRGAIPYYYREFRGVCTAVDATELPPYLSPDAKNVDLETETIKRRRGSVAYNSAPTANAVRGLGAYYPRTGARSILMAAGGNVYADRNQNGSFGDANETLVSGLASTVPWDFWQYREKMYFGNETDGVYFWDGASAAGAIVAPITAPASAPGLDIIRDLTQSFDSGTWTIGTGGTSLSTAYDAADKREGTNALQLTAADAGAAAEFMFNIFGATVDLSKSQYVNVWVKSTQAGAEVQIAFYADGTTPAAGTPPAWDKFKTVTIPAANTWYQVHVELENIAPKDREASPGMAIRWLSSGGRTYPITVSFDDARSQGSMTPDRYSYYYTYRNVDSGGNVIRESAPSPVAEIDLPADSPFQGVAIVTAASGASEVNEIGIYRKRKDGFWGRPKLVMRVANASTAYEDFRDDGEVDIDTKTTNLIEFRNAPPRAKTYCMVGPRLFCGNIRGSTNYPNRVYISALGQPENFSPSEHVLVDDPNAAGWVDLPNGVEIVRILNFEGMAVLFCNGGIYTIEGDGWRPNPNPFRVRFRGSYGIISRNAVCLAGRLFYFASDDGIRVLAANRGFVGEFPCWMISDSVRSLYVGGFSESTNIVIGEDELGRIHVCDNDTVGVGDFVSALVFDPRQPGALNRPDNAKRPGWTRYGVWKFNCFLKLRADGTDKGQLLGGSTSTGIISYLQINASGDDIAYTGTFYWTSRAEKAPNERIIARYLRLRRRSQISDQLRLSFIYDRETATSTQTITGAVDAFATQSTNWKQLCTYLQAKVQEGAAGTEHRHQIHEVEVGVYASR